MSQTSLRHLSANVPAPEGLTADRVERWLGNFCLRTGKLWPLQAVNACNPLAAYEYLPFPEALTRAVEELDFSIERSLDVLKRLYQEQAFTDRDIEAALAKDRQPWLSRTIALSSGPVTYRELLGRELRCLMASPSLDLAISQQDSGHWPDEIRQALEQGLSSWFERQTEPGEIPVSPGGLPMHPHHQAWINEQSAKWLAAYMDEGHAAWGMPGQEQPFRQAWAALILMDGQVPPEMKPALKSLVSRWVQPNLPPEEAIAQLGLENQLTAEQQEQWMDSHLRQLPGWAAYIHYCQSTGSHAPTLLADYLLMRLIYHMAGASLDWGEVELPATPVHRHEAIEIVHRLSALYASGLLDGQSTHDLAADLQGQASEWLAYCHTVTPAQQLTALMAALEHAQQSPLVAALSQACLQAKPARPGARVPDAQAVFCIDVRSEPYRKHLEELGSIETYGFAGFFGLPIAKLSYADEEAVAVCPILLQPKYSVPEAPSALAHEDGLGDLLRQGLPFSHQWTYALKKIKREPFATFSYVEGIGLVHALTMLKDSFASLPFGRFHQAVRSRLLPLLGLKPQLDPQLEPKHAEHGALHTGIALPEQVALAKNILTMMGLRQPYAEFVIMCGHTAQAYNNLYASSLNCGACGANGGGFNALVLCQILNTSAVREALAMEGLQIPADTRFIAAEHNTTTDTVTFLNPEVVTGEQQVRFAQVQATFEEATLRNRQVRLEHLKEHGQVSAPANLVSVSYDWSQSRPEWGLSRNQAFIIGDRQESRHLDLEGRCFLHSYDWESDTDASVLTMIMTAPMVVGAWINLQYDFSTLDAQRFGSGRKYLHNAVGLFGTYVGNASDLQVGLPYESLFANDGAPYHYPQRMLVFVTAPLARVEAIVASQPQVRNLVQNEWVHLMVYDPETRVTQPISPSIWADQ